MVMATTTTLITTTLIIDTLIINTLVTTTLIINTLITTTLGVESADSQLRLTVLIGAFRTAMIAVGAWGVDRLGRR